MHHLISISEAVEHQVQEILTDWCKRKCYTHICKTVCLPDFKIHKFEVQINLLFFFSFFMFKLHWKQSCKLFDMVKQIESQ